MTNAETICRLLATRWFTSRSSVSSRALLTAVLLGGGLVARAGGRCRAPWRRPCEQVEEIVADRLDDIIGRAGLERGDRDALSSDPVT